MADITVREAVQEDLDWVMERIIESSVYSIPHGRDIPNETVKRIARSEFIELMQGEDKVVVLIAENQEGERMGLLLLNLSRRNDATGEKQSFIEDLDVDPRFWGTPAVNRLVKRAAQVTAENGLRYMVGHISEGNRRTLVKAKRLGFQVERYHLAMGVTEAGPGPLPTRDEEEKAHDQSRTERRAKRAQHGKKP